MCIRDSPAPVDPPTGHREYAPNRSMFAASDHGRMLVFSTARGDVLADLGDIEEVTWITTGRLVAFGQGLQGGFDGLAIVDLHDRTVEQVDTHGRDEGGFRPLTDAANDGTVEVCQLAYDAVASAPRCVGDETWDLDTTAADLGEPLVMVPLGD